MAADESYMAYFRTLLQGDACEAWAAAGFPGASPEEARKVFMTGSGTDPAVAFKAYMNKGPSGPVIGPSS